MRRVDLPTREVNKKGDYSVVTMAESLHGFNRFYTFGVIRYYADRLRVVTKAGTTN